MKQSIILVFLICCLTISACGSSSTPRQQSGKPFQTDAYSLKSSPLENNVPVADGLDEATSEIGYEGILRIEHGKLLPMLNYSEMRSSDYTNENNDIQRFCVYVETDHDTDNDGKADLVKAFVQVPTAAVDGKYKAATIYDPTPYAAGTVNSDYFSEAEGEKYTYLEKPFDYEKLYKAGEKRTPSGDMSTKEAALCANPEDWDYTIAKTGQLSYEYGIELDYYLVRGYAIVEACGIGTFGSEGFELCGTDLERDSHKCVVEWLTGDRIAFTDKENNIEIKADWSNGKVAMTGCSYGGTLPYEVATTGVKGLETIIPYAGIASWYDYTNSQGVPLRSDPSYKHALALYNCGGVFLDDDWTVLNDEYRSWLWQVEQDEDVANGKYTQIWAESDYSDDYEKINCSALIIQGLNDINVNTRQAQLMYNAFKKANKTVKLVLHQDGHATIRNIMVDNEPWLEIENKWLAHYLYGVDNGIENMAEITAQNNITGEFDEYDSFGKYKKCVIYPEESDSKTDVTSEGLGDYTISYYPDSEFPVEEMENFYLEMPISNAAIYDVDIPEGATISGVPEIHAKLSTPNTDLEGLMITAVLIDTVDEGKLFDAYICYKEDENLLPSKDIDVVDIGGGAEPIVIVEPEQTPTTAKCISHGWTDLANPGRGPKSSEYAESEDLQTGKYYDYTFYMIPTVYTVEKGHSLKLLLMTWDPYIVFLDENFFYEEEIPDRLDDYNYSYVIDNKSLYAELPLIAE
ncbi:CocE/NonD family hydrolase [Butyrivibrio sp. XPD2002]|uniref:CocE/NonD family hydrolase n=1 Tax=Butyrivibrio sp. XPD2002 TaxID=1280665 RepID=UPI0009DC102B|nr:CocE/NonD family hydrolase [Butyrivibrio sp. XPD2002]